MASPTIRDVAARAGVSTAVVSYVLNDGPRPVAGPTRERVERAIAELGYRRNDAARALRAGQTMTVGCLVPTIVNQFFAQLVDAIETAARDLGLRVLIGSTQFDDACVESSLDMLLEARVDGLVVVPTTTPDEALRRAREARVPVVVVHRDMLGSTPSVAGDDESGGRLAAEHLIEHGHEVVACLTGPTPGSPVRNRTVGFAAGLEAGGRVLDQKLSVSCDYRALERDTYGKTMRLLRARPDVTAIGAMTDVQAFAALQAAAVAGRRVGEDLAVIGLDGTAHASMATPGLTSVRTPFEELARAALRSFGSGAAAATPEVRSTFAMTLERRASCGCHWSPGQR